MQRILSTKMPMFHVKHLSLFKAVCGDDYVEAYSVAGKTHLHEQIENQKENAI